MKKRLLALIMAATMVVAMPITAFADGDTNNASTVTSVTTHDYRIVENVTTGATKVDNANHKLTINNTIPDHTISAYKIFEFEIYNNDEILVSWGKKVNDAGKQKYQTAVNADDSSAYKVAYKLGLPHQGTAESVENFLNTALDVFVKDTNNNSDNTVGVTGNSTTLEINEGYYFIVDREKDGKVASYSLQLILGDKVVNSKTVSITVDKEVLDKNDSDLKDSTNKYGDTADYDIGDDVEYKLVGTLADNFEQKDSAGKYYPFPYKFVDKMGAGLTFNNDVKVYVSNNVSGADSLSEIDSSLYSVSFDKDHNTFEVEFKNLHDVAGVTTSSKIEVRFTAKLNENASIGSDATTSGNNDNEATLKYGNDYKFESNTDLVRVFTYKVTINKVDDNNKPLTGADFDLYKYYDGAKDLAGKLEDGDFSKIVTTHKDNCYFKVVNLEDIKTVDETGTHFSFTGLDDGDYVLVESKVPEGYNQMNPYAFTISATHGKDGLTLDSVSSTEFSTDADKKSGVLSKDIVNRQGSMLPSTGGIGTTLFYIIGGVLVVGAGVVLFTKKKMSNEQ